MRWRSGPGANRDDEYWDWFAVALFLLVTVDLLTTLGAVAAVGIGAEANPLVAWLIGRGTVALMLANLLAVAVAGLTFSRVLTVVGMAPTPYDRYLEVGIEVWLGLLVAVGLALFANNLSVIVQGQSLL